MPSSPPSNPIKPIIVWCVPRSCSTAFERAFMQRTDTVTAHEPFGDPFYWSRSRACRRYSDAQCAAHDAFDTTTDGVARDLIQGKVDGASIVHNDGVKYLFIKDMAQYVFSAASLHALHPDSRVFPDPAADANGDANGNANGNLNGKASSDDPSLPPPANPTVLPTSVLRAFTHTFLIRTPRRAIPSYHKAAMASAGGFEYFDPAEAGYEELRLLYRFLSDPRSEFNAGALSPPQPPPLIDAQDLLADPHHVVRAYCEAVGVPFEENMLHWKAEKVEQFSKWDGYHGAAEQSTGFRQEEPVQQNGATASSSPVSSTSPRADETSTSPNGSKSASDCPEEAEEVQETVDRCLPAYEWLRKRTTIHAPSLRQ